MPFTEPFLAAGRAPGLSCAACATSFGKNPGVALAAHEHREHLFLQVPPRVCAVCGSGCSEWGPG